MTEGENKKLKSLIRFHSANKIDNYNEAGGVEGGGGGRVLQGEKEKNPKNLQKSQNIRIINVFLSHCCQSPFPRWESQSTSPPKDALQHCADIQTCCGGSSDSNLVLLLCVLASSAHSSQN